MGGAEKEMDPLLATQGVGPGGGTSPPILPEAKFLHNLHVSYSKIVYLTCVSGSKVTSNCFKVKRISYSDLCI